MDISRRSAVGLAAASIGAFVVSACSSTEPESAARSSSPGSSPSQDPSPSTSPSEEPTPEVETEVWDDVAAVSHLFFHSLVVDPQRAFDGDSRAAGYLDYMVTVEEFTAILEQVHQNGYVLVSPHDLFTVDDAGAVSRAELEVPKGKKPLVLSVDDVSYYSYMEGDGFASTLKVEGGRVTNTYVDASGAEHTGSYDVVPLLDDFIDEHPDFSPTGARGVIAMTGYDGVLGYRTSPTANGEENDHLAQSRDTAAEVAAALRESGWEFASHTWGHIDCGGTSTAAVRADMKRWKDEVEPLVGETNLLIYPFGADIAGIEHYSGPRFDFLKSQGFDAFFNVDASTTAWGQFDESYMRQARINVDGISLKAAVQGEHEVLQAFFDPASVLDAARPDAMSGTS